MFVCLFVCLSVSLLVCFAKILMIFSVRSFRRWAWTVADDATHAAVLVVSAVIVAFAVAAVRNLLVVTCWVFVSTSVIKL